MFDTVGEAVRKTGANASVIYVPARFAADAVLEAADAGVQLIVCITEGIPVLDMVRVRAYLDAKGSSLLLGPKLGASFACTGRDWPTGRTTS